LWEGADQLLRLLELLQARLISSQFEHGELAPFGVFVEVDTDQGGDVE
jgi:hypothetical protein